MQRQLGRKVARLGDSEYRAVDGRISMTDTRDGSYATRSVTETLKHMEELHRDMGPRIKANPRYYRPVIQFFEAIADVIIEAKKQGPPENADVMADRVRRRPTQIRF
jgi:hypothetical protein